MRAKKLPEYIEQSLFNYSGVEYNVRLSQALFPRLQKITIAGDAVIDLELNFRLNEAGQSIIQGHYKLEILLQCQRCLNTFSQPAENSFYMSVNYRESSSKVQGITEEQCAPDELIVYTDEPLTTLAMLEDELLLGLPQYATHKNISDCDQDMIKRSTEIEYESINSKSNPFSVLKNLKISE